MSQTDEGFVAGPELTVSEWQWIERAARMIAGRWDDAHALSVANKVDAYLSNLTEH